MTAMPHRQKPSTTEPQIEREDCDLFWEVIRNYGSLVFSERNPDPIARRYKRNSVEGNFAKDVESATNCALQRTSLIDDWLRLAKGEKRIRSSVRKQIISLCAPVYRERGLSPDSYFAPSGQTGGRRYGVQRTQAKSSVRNYNSHHRYGVLEKNTSVLCHDHGMQTVKDYFKNHDGNIMRLQCGCDRRANIARAVPVKSTVACIAALPAATPLPFGDDTTMFGWFDNAA
jgi:hypothetical protein